MDQPQPGFVAVPFAQPHARHPEYHGNEVPARVMVACDVLRDLTFKTMTRGMANDVGFDTIEGQKLIFDELRMQAAACDMLTEYFRGHLRPSGWEEFLIVNGLQRQQPPPQPQPAQPQPTNDDQPPARRRKME